jgi:hypothetical protein
MDLHVYSSEDEEPDKIARLTAISEELETIDFDEETWQSILASGLLKSILRELAGNITASFSLDDVLFRCVAAILRYGGANIPETLSNMFAQEFPAPEILAADRWCATPEGNWNRIYLCANLVRLKDPQVGTILDLAVSLCPRDPEAPLLQRMQAIEHVIVPGSNPIELDSPATFAFLEDFLRWTVSDTATLIDENCLRTLMFAWELIYRLDPGHCRTINLPSLRNIHNDIIQRQSYPDLHVQFAALVDAVCKSEPPELSWQDLSEWGLCPCVEPPEEENSPAIARHTVTVIRHIIEGRESGRYRFAGQATAAWIVEMVNVSDWNSQRKAVHCLHRFLEVIWKSKPRTWLQELFAQILPVLNDRMDPSKDYSISLSDRARVRRVFDWFLHRGLGDNARIPPDSLAWIENDPSAAASGQNADLLHLASGAEDRPLIQPMPAPDPPIDLDDVDDQLREALDQVKAGIYEEIQNFLVSFRGELQNRIEAGQREVGDASYDEHAVADFTRGIRGFATDCSHLLVERAKTGINRILATDSSGVIGLVGYIFKEENESFMGPLNSLIGDFLANLREVLSAAATPERRWSSIQEVVSLFRHQVLEGVPRKTTETPERVPETPEGVVEAVDESADDIQEIVTRIAGLFDDFAEELRQEFIALARTGRLDQMATGANELTMRDQRRILGSAEAFGHQLSSKIEKSIDPDVRAEAIVLLSEEEMSECMSPMTSLVTDFTVKMHGFQGDLIAKVEKEAQTTPQWGRSTAASQAVRTYVSRIQNLADDYCEAVLSALEAILNAACEENDLLREDIDKLMRRRSKPFIKSLNTFTARALRALRGPPRSGSEAESHLAWAGQEAADYGRYLEGAISSFRDEFINQLAAVLESEMREADIRPEMINEEITELVAPVEEAFDRLISSYPRVLEEAESQNGDDAQQQKAILDKPITLDWRARIRTSLERFSERLGFAIEQALKLEAEDLDSDEEFVI